MTYISGQPIVFVGTGQTYTDLKSLNAKVNFIQIVGEIEQQYSNYFDQIENYFFAGGGDSIDEIDPAKRE